MRISDWSSDVCSSDLACVGSPGRAAQCQLGQSITDRASPTRETCRETRAMASRRLPAATVRATTGRTATTATATITTARSEEHTSELQSLMRISYAVFCLKKKTIKTTKNLSIIYNHH